jgi:hypothetical protein
MSTQHVYCIGSVQDGFISLTNHLYRNCSALIFWLHLISRIRQLFQTADLSYSLPAHRATVYIMGIVLGFVLRYCGRDFRLKKVCVRFEVICVVTVDIAVSCVVTAYGPIFWWYLLLPSAWWKSKPHPYKTAVCRPADSIQFNSLPLVLSQTLVPNICSFYYYYCICFPYVSIVYSEEVGSGPSVMFVSFYQTTWCHMSDECNLMQIWHCAMAGVG